MKETEKRYNKNGLRDLQSIQQAINAVTKKERNTIPLKVPVEVVFRQEYPELDQYTFRGQYQNRREIFVISAVMRSTKLPAKAVLGKEFPLAISPSGMQYLVNYLAEHGEDANLHGRTFTCYRPDKERHLWSEITGTTKENTTNKLERTEPTNRQTDIQASNEDLQI